MGAWGGNGADHDRAKTFRLSSVIVADSFERREERAKGTRNAPCEGVVAVVRYLEASLVIGT